VSLEDAGSIPSLTAWTNSGGMPNDALARAERARLGLETDPRVEAPAFPDTAVVTEVTEAPLDGTAADSLLGRPVTVPEPFTAPDAVATDPMPVLLSWPPPSWDGLTVPLAGPVLVEPPTGPLLSGLLLTKTAVTATPARRPSTAATAGKAHRPSTGGSPEKDRRASNRSANARTHADPPPKVAARSSCVTGASSDVADAPWATDESASSCADDGDPWELIMTEACGGSARGV
jgi:hypothetical protein